MNHRDLLRALAEREPIDLKGEFERHTSLRWDELRASPAGGRWGAPAAFEVLYLGRPRDSIVVEAYRHLVDDELDEAEALAASVVERRVVTLDVDVANVADLRPESARMALRLSEAHIYSEVGAYDACQAVGAASHQLGLTGLIAPAATRLGETLALFPTNLPIERWPTVTRREIWHELPADPRRLRLADEAP